jgi:pimeloyl-ACP methyl ester carboxylesterase
VTGSVPEQGAIRMVRVSDGQSLAVWDNGVDGEAVIFVHGFPQNHRCWDGVIAAMRLTGRPLRYIAYDLRGHGASSKSGEASLQRFFLDHQDIVAALNIERYHLVGHDWGGAVGLHASRYCPEQLLSLVVLNTNYWETHIPGMWHMLVLNIPIGAPIAFALAPDAIFDAFITRSLASPRQVSPAAMESYRSAFHDRAATGFWIRLYRSMAGELLRQALPTGLGSLIPRSPIAMPRTSKQAFQTPTLIVWGARDTFNPLSIGKGIETHLRSFGAPVEFAALDDARHFVAEDRPQDVARLVSAHLEACGPPMERALH